MSDARFIDVEDDLAVAIRHFRMAVLLFEEGGFEGIDIVGYRASMALMHALQSGHTSVEAALVKALDILGEDPPHGGDWHATIIRRLSRERRDEFARPAILSPELARDLDETRRFRHRAMHVYEGFDARLAAPAVEAAERLVTGLGAIVERLKSLDG